ncbi:MAG: FmdB family zinc ribbon protein [Bacteroidota bacterium]
MPTYDYDCSQCGRFEYFQRISDQPLSACPTCGGSVRRLISASAGILFKGDGFHTTDYRSNDYRKRAKEEGGSSEPKKKETTDMAPSKAS